MRTEKMTVTERLARASARHRWLTLGGWLVAFCVAIAVVVTMLGSALTTEQSFINEPEAQRESI